MKYTTFFASLLVLASSQAKADQCAYIEKATAQAALKIALETSRLEALCEPCGETQATVLDVKSIGIADVNYQGFWELQINGKTADLAYTYVNGMNLAKLVSCPVHNVSSSITK